MYSCFQERIGGGNERGGETRGLLGREIGAFGRWGREIELVALGVLRCWRRVGRGWVVEDRFVIWARSSLRAASGMMVVRGRGRILLGLSVAEGDLVVVRFLHLALLVAVAFPRTGCAISQFPDLIQGERLR